MNVKTIITGPRTAVAVRLYLQTLHSNQEKDNQTQGKFLQEEWSAFITAATIFRGMQCRENQVVQCEGAGESHRTFL